MQNGLTVSFRKLTHPRATECDVIGVIQPGFEVDGIQYCRYFQDGEFYSMKSTEIIETSDFAKKPDYQDALKELKERMQDRDIWVQGEI